jgi:hypothetical protein
LIKNIIGRKLFTMADLNVFQLTNQELHKTEKKSNVTVKKTSKKSFKESFGSKRRARKPFAIPANKLQFESLSRFLEADSDDEVVDELTVDYTPEDDVVLVIDPDMEEVPEDTEEAIEAAEELVGQHVCKCAICGANYVTDAEITEEVEIEDQECPVCGETGDQIVVGVITPTEELSTDDEEDIDDVDIDDESDEEDIDVDIEDDEFSDDDVDVEETEDEEDEFGESLRRSRMHTMRRRAESVRRRPSGARLSARMPRSARPVNEDFAFDEATFNRMLTKFAKENYSNVKAVKISRGCVRGNRMTLEGVVTTTKGSKRPIKFVSERFDKSARMSLRFKEYGPFTESVRNSDSTFIVDCVSRNGKVIPTALRYSFNAKNAGGSMKESRNTYTVSGKVLSESNRNKRR